MHNSGSWQTNFRLWCRLLMQLPTSSENVVIHFILWNQWGTWIQLKPREQGQPQQLLFQHHHQQASQFWHRLPRCNPHEPIRSRQYKAWVKRRSEPRSVKRLSSHWNHNFLMLMISHNEHSSLNFQNNNQLTSMSFMRSNLGALRIFTFLMKVFWRG